MTASRSTLRAIGLMVLAMAFFSAMNTLIRIFAVDLPTPFMVFLRNLLGLALLAPWLFRHGITGLRTRHPWRHAWRAGVGLLAMESWFYTLSVLPINEATALSFTSPLFATVFAVFFLRETVGPLRIAGLLTGFAGTLVILRPGEIEVLPAAIALFSTAMMAVAGILVKSLTATEPPGRIVFYMTLLMCLLSAPFGLADSTPLTGAQWLGMLAIAALSTLAQFAMASAFARAPMVALVPFDFTRLIFTALLAWMLFDETLDAHTLFGACIILASAVFVTWRETRWRKRHAERN